MPTVVAPVLTAAPAAVVAAVTAAPVVAPAVMAAAVMAVPTAEAIHNRPMLPSTTFFTVTFVNVPFLLICLSEINVRADIFPSVELVVVLATVDLFGVVGATGVVCSNPVLFLRSIHGVVATVDVVGVVATVELAVVEASGSVRSIINSNAI